MVLPSTSLAALRRWPWTRVRNVRARACSPLFNRLVPISVQLIRLRHKNKARSVVSRSGARPTSLLTRRESSPSRSKSTAEPSDGNQADCQASTKSKSEAFSKWNSPLTRLSKTAVPLPNSLT